MDGRDVLPVYVCVCVCVLAWADGRCISESSEAQHEHRSIFDQNREMVDGWNMSVLCRWSQIVLVSAKFPWRTIARQAGRDWSAP